MSRPTKEFMMRDYEERIGSDTDEALVVSIRGVDAQTNNRMRNELRKSGIRVTVVRNGLAKLSLKDTPLAGLSPVLEGPSALVYGEQSVVNVARELMKWAQEVQNLELKGAILDGMLFEGKDGVERLSKFPTREEAIAKNVTLVLSPGRNLMGAVKAPGANLLAVVKAIQEKLEKGEAIAAVS
jgi:large subunit ribosomal protein L10